MNFIDSISILFPINDVIDIFTIEDTENMSLVIFFSQTPYNKKLDFKNHYFYFIFIFIFIY